MRITGLLQGAPCATELEAIGLALPEALANAIVHGNRNNPTVAVRVCLAVHEDCRVQVVIKDVDEGFDPNSLPSPVDGENLFEPHGRGVFLMRHLMDEEEFQFNTGTEIRMRRHPAANLEAKPAACAKWRTPAARC